MAGEELFRLIRTKKIIIGLLGYLILSLYFVHIGMGEHTLSHSHQKNIQIKEKKNVSRYKNYEQYGGYGFRIFYAPSPMAALFFNSVPARRIESTVNTSENTRVNNVLDAGMVFKEGLYKDFSGIVFVFASLIMIMLGILCLRNDEYLKAILNKKFISSVVYVFVISIITVAASFLFAVLSVKSKGVGFNDLEMPIQPLLHYGLFAAAFLLFFYATGVTVFAIGKGPKVIVAVAIWVLLNFIIPEFWNLQGFSKSKDLPTVESLIDAKTELLLAHETKAVNKVLPLLKDGKRKEALDTMKRLMQEYIDVEYKKIEVLQEAYSKKIKKRIEEMESLMFYIPSVAYLNISKESSSLGRWNYLNFLNFLYNLKKRFLSFYSTKRYFSKDKTIEPFIKGDENIFRAQPQLPGTYWASLVTTLLISIFLLAGSIIILKRKLKKGEVKEPDFTLKKERFNFVRCRNNETKENLFNYYREQPDTICIDNVSGEDIDPGIAPQHALTYFCKKLGVDISQAKLILGNMGVQYPLKRMYKRRERLELIKKMFLATNLALDSKLVVLNDFLYGEWRKAESDIIHAVNSMLKDPDDEKIFLYLSIEMYRTQSTFTTEEPTQDFTHYPVENLRTISLR